jgi:hypothetical protein
LRHQGDTTNDDTISRDSSVSDTPYNTTGRSTLTLSPFARHDFPEDNLRQPGDDTTYDTTQRSGQCTHYDVARYDPSQSAA